MQPTESLPSSSSSSSSTHAGAILVAAGPACVGSRTSSPARVAAIVAAALAVAPSHADLVAGWNFNAFDPATQVTVAADRGSGLIDLNEVANGLNAFAGTTVNAFGGDAAGLSLTVTGQALNGRSIYLHADVGGASDLTLSFAARRTDSGFSDNRVELWLAGAWTTVGAFAAGSDWPVSRFEFTLPSMITNGTATLRFVLGGATTSSGNLRLDNLRVESRAVPTPGALALLAIAGAAARRRRRG